jgi:uncharacterized membrane protein YjgN (DUF898 family)
MSVLSSSQPIEAHAETEGRPRPLLSFNQRDAGLFNFALKGTFLTVATLGIYRFWYRTNLRRWYWRRTEVDGTGFEYRGTARELFVGFLIALAIILPLYFAGAIAALVGGEVAGSVVTVLAGLIFVVLAQYGAFRSRRYRLTRTAWRGIRFDQLGSARTYALKSLGHLLILILSGGFTLPHLRRALERYRIENTRFGSLEGRFEPRSSPQVLRWWILWGAAMFLLTAGAIAAAQNPIRPGAGAVLALLLGLCLPFALWPWYRAAEIRSFASAAHMGPVSFSSTFRTRTYYWRFIAFGLSMLLLTAVAIMLFSMFFGATVTGGRKHGVAMYLAIAGGFVVYLGMFILGSVLKELLISKPLWIHMCETTTIHGFDAVKETLARHVADEAATGEGFADALDFGGV